MAKLTYVKSAMASSIAKLVTTYLTKICHSYCDPIPGIIHGLIQPLQLTGASTVRGLIYWQLRSSLVQSPGQNCRGPVARRTLGRYWGWGDSQVVKEDLILI